MQLGLVMVIDAGTRTSHGKASADAGEPAAVTADTLQDALAGLKTPIAASTNPNDAQASLEEAHKHILEEGIVVALAKSRMEATQREYNFAYGLTPISEAPSRLGSVRGCGRFIAEILGGNQSVYETPQAEVHGRGPGNGRVLFIGDGNTPLPTEVFTTTGVRYTGNPHCKLSNSPLLLS